jgi:DNA-binding GntR family transcriptional regulator
MNSAIDPSTSNRIPIALSNRQNLAEQVADAIVGGIAAGNLLPGQKLREVDMAALLSVSRVPLREGLKILEAQGIVVSEPHRGTRVTAFSDAKIDQICEARIALEKIAFKDAVLAYRNEPALLERLDRSIVGMELAGEQLDWVAVSKLDLEFHREVCRVSDNVIVATLWEAIARHVSIVFGHEIRGEQDAAILGPQHRKLRDLLVESDIAALEGEIEDHILRLRKPGRIQPTQ